MANIARLTTREIMAGTVMKVRVERLHSLRMRLAMWLLCVAGKVITVPVEIELKRRDG